MTPLAAERWGQMKNQRKQHTRLSMQMPFRKPLFPFSGVKFSGARTRAVNCMQLRRAEIKKPLPRLMLVGLRMNLTIKVLPNAATIITSSTQASVTEADIFHGCNYYLLICVNC